MNDSNISETRCSRDEMTEVAVGDMTFSFSYCNDLPGLTDAEYYDLNEDIGMRGVQVAVIIDEHGAVLDGKHRVLSAAEHKLKTIPIEVKVGLTEEEKQQFAFDLNLKRRHLTSEQRQGLVLKMREKGMSFREIGGKLNVSPETVRTDVQKATVQNWTVELPEKIKGKDGKVRPAKVERKPSVMVKTVNEAVKATEAVQAAGAEHFIGALCPAVGIVLDPMMGSGTAGVASVKLGLEFIGIECDYGTFAVAQERIGGVVQDGASDGDARQTS